MACNDNHAAKKHHVDGNDCSLKNIYDKIAEIPTVKENNHE